MKSSKALGPDRFPTEFFKKFSCKLSPLKKCICQALDRGSLPPTMTQATISVLKKGEDPLK